MHSSACVWCFKGHFSNIFSDISWQETLWTPFETVTNIHQLLVFLPLPSTLFNKKKKENVKQAQPSITLSKFNRLRQNTKPLRGLVCCHRQANEEEMRRMFKMGHTITSSSSENKNKKKAGAQWCVTTVTHFLCRKLSTRSQENKTPQKGQSNQQTGETTAKIPCTVNKKQINKLKNARRDKKLHPAVKLS